jgi:hypothetical protein
MNCVVRGGYLERASHYDRLAGLVVDNGEYPFVKVDDEFFIAPDIITAMRDGEVHLLGDPVSVGGLVMDEFSFSSLVGHGVVRCVALCYGPSSGLYPTLTTIWITAEVLPPLARDVMPRIARYILLVLDKIKEEEQTRDKSAKHWTKLAVCQASLNPTLPIMLDILHLDEIDREDNYEESMRAIDKQISEWRRIEVEKMVPVVKEKLVQHRCLYVSNLPRAVILELYDVVTSDVSHW